MEDNTIYYFGTDLYNAKIFGVSLSSVAFRLSIIDSNKIKTLKYEK